MRPAGRARLLAAGLGLAAGVLLAAGWPAPGTALEGSGRVPSSAGPGSSGAAAPQPATYTPAPSAAGVRTPVLGLQAPAVGPTTLADLGTRATAGYWQGSLARVSTNASGAGANGGQIGKWSVSPDGHYVAFWSDATNLVAGVHDGLPHLYVKGISGTEKGLIGVFDTASDGTLSNGSGGANAEQVQWRPDGKELLFISEGTNLVPGLDLPSGPYLYAKSLEDGSTGFIADGVGDGTWSPNMTWIVFGSRHDGYCTFVSSSGNPCTHVSDGSYQLYAWKVGTSQYRLVSGDADGAMPSAIPDDSYRPVVSPDSRTVAFVSYARDLVPHDTNSSTDVFLKNLSTGAISRGSTTPKGGQANAASDWPVFNPRNAKQVAFQSDADNLVRGDGNTDTDIFLKNLGTGAVRAVSVTKKGRFVISVAGSRAPRFSPDGTRIAYTSRAWNLVPRVDANSVDDVYVTTLRTGAVQLVSTPPNGKDSNGASTLWGAPGSTGGWTKDSRTIVFASDSTNFPGKDRNAFQADLFAKHQ
ncbi:PD40 domain-containing protein [Nocardioides sp. GY 10127]|uniref:TolB family protein n=1 Tax=Nocardioides sp. GY 10127 TaxID=2569762 RepID=UPI0010A93C5D|nr:PD40 domain-containing protein [Nocardioides sp. GY 10127]TIC84372.1 hypothetical protein E8D37_06280 [Nocardioides sp. GY 10127]